MRPGTPPPAEVLRGFIARHWTAVKSVTGDATLGIKDYAKQYGHLLYEFQVYGH